MEYFVNRGKVILLLVEAIGECFWFIICINAVIVFTSVIKYVLKFFTAMKLYDLEFCYFLLYSSFFYISYKYIKFRILSLETQRIK